MSYFDHAHLTAMPAVTLVAFLLITFSWCRPVVKHVAFTFARDNLTVTPTLTYLSHLSHFAHDYLK